MKSYRLFGRNSQLLFQSKDLQNLIKRLGFEFFEEAAISKIEDFSGDFYIMDYVMTSFKNELQILIDLQGNIIGISRAIYSEDHEELLYYLPLGLSRKNESSSV